MWFALSADLDLDDCRRRAFRLNYITSSKTLGFCILTITKKSYVCEALGLEEVAESRGQVAAKTVPFQTELLVLGIHSECEGQALPWPCAVTRPCVDSVWKKTRKNTKLVICVDKTFPAIQV
jgi:hypothetical protein